MNTFLTVLALCCATSFAALDFQADQGCIASSWITLGNSEYSYVEKLMTFNDAQQSCQLCGAHLISIDDPAAEDFAELASTDDKPFWIGASDDGAGGDFSWVDGSSFSYTNYKNGEAPTRVAGGANCLYSKNNAFWKATLCSNTRRFVCERDLAVDSAVVGGQVLTTQAQPAVLTTLAQPTPPTTQAQPTPPTTQAQPTPPTTQAQPILSTIESLSDILNDMILSVNNQAEEYNVQYGEPVLTTQAQPIVLTTQAQTTPPTTQAQPIVPTTQAQPTPPTTQAQPILSTIESLSAILNDMIESINNQAETYDVQFAPTTQVSTSQAPIFQLPTAQVPTSQAPIFQLPTAQVPTSQAPTTQAPTTQARTTTRAPTTRRSNWWLNLFNNARSKVRSSFRRWGFGKK